VVLGTINPIGAELLNGPTWLAVKVNENVEMAPRQKVASAPYALRAGTSAQAEEAANADQLGGVAASEYATQTILAPVATVGLSPDLADGDDDALAALGCGEGMVAKATSIGTWVCGVDDAGGVDTTLNEEEVDAMVADNGYALQADLEAAQTALTELQTLVNGIDTSTGVDISALQSQVVALETALSNAQSDLLGVQSDLANETAARTAADDAEASARSAADDAEATTRSDGDLVLQGNINTVESSLVALDATLDPIAKANLACGEGQVPQHNGSVWECAYAGGSVPTVEPALCDASAVGKIYFDTEVSALKVCDGTSYRKVKLCSEICPDPSTVPCEQAVEDDCGIICGGTGTGLNTNQCNAAVVPCGQTVLDGCGNDCGSNGILLNTDECPDSATVPCGENTTDSCANLCGSQGSLCANPLTPYCDVALCTGLQIVPHVTGRRWADGTYAGSCNGYKNPGAGYSYAGDTGDGAYTIESGGETFDVFCDMTSDGGGWTLVLMVKSDDLLTFRHDSSYWTDTNLLNPDITDPNVDTNMKNRAYESVAFSEMRLAMDTIDNVMVETVTAGAARTLFSGGHVGSPHSRDEFLTWHPMNNNNWDNQPHCNTRGFQPSASATNCRYGLLMNNENECNSNDAAVGFGCHSQDFYVNRTSACGGHRWSPDGAYNYKGWIFVR
jgi:hypothetical protein